VHLGGILCQETNVAQERRGRPLGSRSCGDYWPHFGRGAAGVHKDAEADWVASALAGIQYVELSRKDWRAAAKLGRHLAAGGHFLPLSDLALATATQRHQYSLYSIDPHFDVIPNLKRHVPQDIKKSKKN